MTKRFIVASLFVAALAGCSLTSPRDIGNAHRVFLEPLSGKMACHTRMGSLIVAYPKIPETLDTSRIALVDQTGRWDYFAGMRWADFLADNVQSTLIGSLSASGKFASVSSDDTVDPAHVTLDSAINRFEAVYHADGAPPDVEIEIAFTLREGNGARASKHFIARSKVPATADNADAIGMAFEKAFTGVQRTALKNLVSCTF